MRDSLERFNLRLRHGRGYSFRHMTEEEEPPPPKEPPKLTLIICNPEPVEEGEGD